MTASAFCWSVGQLRAAGHAEVEQRVELVAAEHAGLAGALDLDEVAVAGADHVHVDLGGDVLQVHRSSRGSPSMMPTLTAATERCITSSGLPASDLRPASQVTASCSATYAPVIAAVRVPPSACSTSQSRTIEFSPSAFRSMQARRLRPISREISWVRPPTLPLTLSRSERVWSRAAASRTRR